MVIGFEFCYSTRFYLSADGEDRGTFTATMDTAIQMAKDLIYEEGVEEVACCSAETGEVIFIARAHDDECVEDCEPDYDECGFNPYMGCYDFDC